MNQGNSEAISLNTFSKTFCYQHIFISWSFYCYRNKEQISGKSTYKYRSGSLLQGLSVQKHYYLLLLYAQSKYVCGDGTQANTRFSGLASDETNIECAVAYTFFSLVLFQYLKYWLLGGHKFKILSRQVPLWWHSWWWRPCCWLCTIT